MKYVWYRAWSTRLADNRFTGGQTRFQATHVVSRVIRVLHIARGWTAPFPCNPHVYNSDSKQLKK